MDTALPQKFPFILDRNLAKANCTEDRVCTSCDKVVLDSTSMLITLFTLKSVKSPNEIRRYTCLDDKHAYLS